LPVAVTLSSPDDVQPGTRITIGSGYSIDSDRASLSGDPPGLYPAARAVAGDYKTALPVSES
jgi:hypothetical protein